MGDGDGDVGGGARPPVCPLIPFWLLLLTLHYLQVLSGWRRELLSVSIDGGVCVCMRAYVHYELT